MKIARFAHVSGGSDLISYGVVEGDELALLTGDPFFSPAESTGQRIPLDDVRLLAPIIPRSKVVGVGRNYAAHAAEFGNEVPTAPLLFFKPNTAVIGPDDPIRLPPIDEAVGFEAELAVVIGRIARGISADKAADYILGYTVANDATLRGPQRADANWTRAKGFDTSCPLGPWIDTDFDPESAAVRSYLDGELRQDGTTADLIFDVPTLLEYITETITLLPGDVVLTGTPAGVGLARPGQRVEVEVEGIGRFGNPVLPL